MNNISYFEIQANNLERARSFYTDVFGWKFTQEFNVPLEYWRIETEGIAGGLLPRPLSAPQQPAGTNAFTCSIFVESFDAIADKIMTAGGSIALPKFAIPGRCWQGYFLDTEGNTFGLFQPDENAA